MNANDKLESVRALIDKHNQVFAEKFNNVPGQVNPDDFINCLKFKAAPDLDNGLKALSHEQIKECAPLVFGVKPDGLIKAVAKVLREKEEEPAPFTTHDMGDGVKAYVPTTGVKAKVADMTDRQLVEAFNPAEPDSKVGERLKKISKGQSFIVFESGRKIDVESTVKLLGEIKEGHNQRDKYKVGDVWKLVYPIGELPDNMVDENPLYPGRPLRPDGSCDVTEKTWAGVAKNVRQLLRLAVNEHELDLTAANGELLAKDIIYKAVTVQDAFKKFADDFNKAAIKFAELEKLGNLPPLMVQLSRQVGKAGGQRPFDGGKKVDMGASVSSYYLANNSGNTVRWTSPQSRRTH
jgi:hypothetical protein